MSEIYGEDQVAWFGCYDGHTFKSLRGDIVNGTRLEPYESMPCPYVYGEGFQCTRKARILDGERMTIAEFLAEVDAIERNPYRWEEEMFQPGDRIVREFCRLARNLAFTRVRQVTQ